MALVSFILSCLHSGAPQITVSAPTYVIQSDTLTVNCSVTSFPRSNVSLSLNGTPIMTSDSEDYDSTAGSFTYFTAHSTTAVHPSDEGNYTCSATITHGQPAVTEVFSDTAFVAVYGGSCSHAHYSTGEGDVLWACTHNRLTHTHCNCDSVHYPHSHAAHTDTELYCTPDSDTDGQPCSLLYSLHTVTVRPTVTLSPSVSGPVSVGDVVMFTCTASGGVPSEYSFGWFNGNAEVMSGDSVRITSDGTTSTLMLTVGPDDFVNYTCSVNNTFTEALESIMLVEACK